MPPEKAQFLFPSFPNNSGTSSFDWLFNDTQSPHPYAEHETLRLITDYAFIVLGVVGFLANLVVISTVLATKRLKTNTYVLILNACVADLFVLGFKTIPSFFEMKNEGQWILGTVMCKLYGVSWTLADCASILLMVAIASERYIVITKPLHAPSILTKRNRVTTVALIWLLSIAVSLRELMHYELKDLFGSKYCTKLHVSSQTWFLLAEFLLFFVVPLLTMSYLYGAVIKSIRESINIRRGMVAVPPTSCGSNDRSETDRARLRIVGMMIVVGVLFTVTSVTAKWAILFCSYVLNIVPLTEFGHNFAAYFWIHNCFLFRSLDSVANPFVYFGLSANLRESFCAFFEKPRPKPTVQSGGAGLNSTQSRLYTSHSAGASSYELQNVAHHKSGHLDAKNNIGAHNHLSPRTAAAPGKSPIPNSSMA